MLRKFQIKFRLFDMSSTVKNIISIYAPTKSLSKIKTAALTAVMLTCQWLRMLFVK